jgi:hypothetical protein
LHECGEQNISGMDLVKPKIQKQSKITKDIPLRQLTNIAKFYAEVIACGQLTLTILKVKMHL